MSTECCMWLIWVKYDLYLHNPSQQSVRIKHHCDKNGNPYHTIYLSSNFFPIILWKFQLLKLLFFYNISHPGIRTDSSKMSDRILNVLQQITSYKNKSKIMVKRQEELCVYVWVTERQNDKTNHKQTQCDPEVTTIYPEYQSQNSEVIFSQFLSLIPHIPSQQLWSTHIVNSTS